MKRLAALLAAFAVFFCTFALPASAADSGKWGNIGWSLDGSGTLTLTGSGAMNAFPSGSSAAWRAAGVIGRIKRLIIEEGVTSVSAGAFRGCAALESVVMAGSVSSVGQWAFRDCAVLESISIPESVVNLGAGAFLDTAFYNKESSWKNGVLLLDGCVLDHREALAGSFAPKGDIRLIADDAFFGAHVESVTLPEGVVSVGNRAFESCPSLESASLPSTLVRLGDSAFESCRALSVVSLPKKLSQIGERTFRGCSALAHVTLPEGLKGIGKGAFEDCESLENLCIPKSVESIGESAFFGCTALRSVLILCPVAINAPEDAGSVTDNALTVIFGGGALATDYVKQRFSHAGKAFVDGEIYTWYRVTAKCTAHYLVNGSCIICGKGAKFVTLGDANGDGICDNLDAVIALACDAGHTSLDAVQKAALDVNCDGKTNNTDAARILLYDAGIVKFL